LNPGGSVRGSGRIVSHLGDDLGDVISDLRPMAQGELPSCRIMPSMRPKSWWWSGTATANARNTGHSAESAQSDMKVTITTHSLNRVQSLRSRRPGKSPAAMLGEAEWASGKPGERRRHLRCPRRSPPLPHFDAFASAAFSAARAPARMLAMA
jgi:hypothetical protein